MSGSSLGLDTSGGSLAYGYAISNPNVGANVLSLTKLGPNTLLLSGSNSYSGGTAINNGTLSLGNSAALPNSALTISGGTLDVNNYSATVASLSSAAATAIVNSGGSPATLTINGSASTAANGAIGGNIAVVYNGAGQLTLGSANTFTGGLTIGSGTVALGNAGALNVNDTVTVNGGALNLANNSETIAGLSGSGGTVSSTGKALILTGSGTYTYGGAITGTTLLTVNLAGTGSQTLSGINTYSGATAVESVLNVTGAALGNTAVTLTAGTLSLQAPTPLVTAARSPSAAPAPTC